MSTTLLFVELLIAGIQVVIWMVLLVLAVFGYQWAAGLPFQALSEWQALFGIVGLSIVYVLGILFDRVADLIFSRWDRAIRARIFPDVRFTHGVLRYQLSKDNEYLGNQFEYTRSRMRIARASAMNLAFTTILSEVFIVRWLQGIPEYSRLIIFIGVVGALLTLLAVYTWHKLVRSYMGTISVNYQAREEAAKAGDLDGEKATAAETATHEGKAKAEEPSARNEKPEQKKVLARKKK